MISGTLGIFFLVVRSSAISCAQRSEKIADELELRPRKIVKVNGVAWTRFQKSEILVTRVERLNEERERGVRLYFQWSLIRWLGLGVLKAFDGHRTLFTLFDESAPGC
jgi:hypothetical protein